jgi:hypothetical protein
MRKEYATTNRRLQVAALIRGDLMRAAGIARKLEYREARLAEPAYDDLPQVRRLAEIEIGMEREKEAASRRVMARVLRRIARDTGNK